MNDYFGKDASNLAQKKLFLFDMDGTIYMGNRLFEGVTELLGKIEKKGGMYVFITNNSSKSVKDYVKKVRKMGIKADRENFFTSAQAAVMIFEEKFPNRLVYCQGTKSFIKELKKSGMRVTQKYTSRAEAVLVGFDPELTGKKLENTCKTLMRDLPYYATNPDWVCPTEFGAVPDCGSMCFGIEHATGKKPVFIGKPEPMMIQTVMKKFSASREETLVIGDRLYTDIASGVNAGVDTVCVLCGETKLRDIKGSAVQPTYIFTDVKEMTPIL